MKAKITLLTVSIAILLTACGQKANGQINAVPPPATAVQEETQPPQPSTGPTTTGQSPAAASTSVQELSQEDELQPKATPQVTQTPEPVTEPAPAEDIPSVTVSAKTGYDADSVQTPAPEGELESAPAPEPAHGNSWTEASFSWEISSYFTFEASAPVQAAFLFSSCGAETARRPLRRTSR